MTGTAVRRARPDDAAGINAVYNPFIRESPATFETVEHSDDQRRRWIEAHLADPRHEVLAAEADGAIKGFANASPFDPRGGYASSVKVSVFIDPAAAGEGLGGRLYGALFDMLQKTDLHRAYGLIVAPNPASVALHERFGFTHVATLSEVGRKFGCYYDVMWFEKKLS